MDVKMDIAIYGAGSLGTIIGAYLTKAGVVVDLISRNKSQVEGLKKNGARIIGTVEMTVPVNAMLPVEMSKKYDLIFLLTKQLDNENTVKFLDYYLKEDGAICTAQNGLPEFSIAEIIGKDRTFGCAVAWGATLIGEGVSELTSSPGSLTFNIGTLGNNKSRLNEIKSILGLLGEVTIEENFIGARWSKILINSAFSGMSAVLGCTFGEATKNKRSRFCIQRIIKECIDVAANAGIEIEPVQGKDIRRLLDYKNMLKQMFVFFIIPFVIKKHSLLKASMLQDLEKKKATEIDFINGIVSSFGSKYGVSTAYCDKIVEIVHGIEKGKYKPGFENLLLFQNLK
jgi:2-dehydropantoate 2-reductase